MSSQCRYYRPEICSRTRQSDVVGGRTGRGCRMGPKRRCSRRGDRVHPYCERSSSQRGEPSGSSAVAEHGTVSDYWTLTKPEVNFLIAVATLTGFYLGRPAQLDHFPWLRLVHTLLGTLLVASGTGTL